MSRINNLDFLRFIGASIVVFGHAQAIAGNPQTIILGVGFASIGVMIFFTISGYLITESWERSKSLQQYLVNRCLRIFPALFVVITLSAIVLGPFVTWLDAKDYFSNPHFWGYFRNIGLYIVYNLPGVFDNNPLKYAVNGSLWSLPPEVLCYVIVIIIGIVFRPVRKYVYIFMFAFCAALCLYSRLTSNPGRIIFYASDLYQTVEVSIYFMAGATIRYFGIPRKFTVALVLFAIHFVCSFFMPILITIILNWFIFSYFILCLGLCATPVLNNWGKFGDCSYGIYLYSFPIQQTICYLCDGQITTGMLIVISYPLSILCGYLSWHFVEKRMLKLKRWFSQPLGITVAYESNKN